MAFVFLYNQPKVAGVQDLWFEVLKMLPAINTAEKTRYTFYTQQQYYKMQFRNYIYVCVL